MKKTRDEQDANVISRFSKKRRASSVATAFSLVKRVYPDAVELTGVPPGSRGLLLLLGLFSVGIAGIAGYHIVEALLAPGELYTFEVIMNFLLLLIMLPSIYLAVLCVRLELFKLEDEPIIFDRRKRKVYRIFSEKDFSLKGLFQSWPTRVAEYDWDSVEAEHHVSINANTATVSRVHALIFQVRSSRANVGVEEGFAVGSSLQMGELTVPAVWEYIRRFMEEAGPSLPEGECVVEARKPESLWGAIVAMGLFGENFKKWWASARGLTILALVFSPIVYPILTLLGIFVWLGYKTSTPVQWPEYIVERVERRPT